MKAFFDIREKIYDFVEFCCFYICSFSIIHLLQKIGVCKKQIFSPCGSLIFFRLHKGSLADPYSLTNDICDALKPKPNPNFLFPFWSPVDINFFLSKLKEHEKLVCVNVLPSNRVLPSLPRSGRDEVGRSFSGPGTQ